MKNHIYHNNQPNSFTITNNHIYHNNQPDIYQSHGWYGFGRSFLLVYRIDYSFVGCFFFERGQGDFGENPFQCFLTDDQ